MSSKAARIGEEYSCLPLVPRAEGLVQTHANLKFRIWKYVLLWLFNGFGPVLTRVELRLIRSTQSW